MEYKVNLEDTIKISDSVLTTKEYYQKYPKVIILNILIILASSLIGLIVTGILGVVVGFIIGILSFFYLPSGITKIKEVYDHR